MGAAAAKFTLPDWLARIVHVPPATSVTALPFTVHVPPVVDANVTGNPDDAVALSVNDAEPSSSLKSYSI